MLLVFQLLNAFFSLPTKLSSKSESEQASWFWVCFFFYLKPVNIEIQEDEK